MVWNACMNWLWLIEPEPVGSIRSNRSDIFWVGDIGTLALDVMPAASLTPALGREMFMEKSGLADFRV